MKVKKKWYGLIVMVGALLWIAVGIIYSLREPGNGHGVYRKTYDLFFVLGIGITMILGSLAHLLWQFRGSHRQISVIAIINLLGGLTYLVGGIIVAVNPGPFPYLLFLGYLVSVLGLILTGVFGRRYKLFPAPVSLIIIGIGGCLLFFNDQYMPWMASVLGAAALWLSYRFFFRTHHSRTLESETDKSVLSR